MKRLLVVLAVVACTRRSERIGVAECDAYETKMAACADKVGGNVGEQLQTMRRMMRSAWQKDARDPELPRVCAAALADMERQLPQCVW